MKILMIGSGPEQIGKTGTYDRFTVEACRFLRAEGHETVWIDNNPATLASGTGVADRVYLEPLTSRFLEKVIDREAPDAVMHDMGGSLASHLLFFLDREGVLARKRVNVLGTSVGSLAGLLDEEILKKNLRDKDIPFLEPTVIRNLEECVRVSRELGFPLVLRPAFALEGDGGYLVYNVEEVKRFAGLALYNSPVKELIVQPVPADSVQLGLECMHDPTPPGNLELVGTLEPLVGNAAVHFGNTVVMSPSPTLAGDLLVSAMDWAARIAAHYEIRGTFHLRLCYSPSDGATSVMRVIHGLSRYSTAFAALHNLPVGKITAGLCLGVPYADLKERFGFSASREGKACSVRIPSFVDAGVLNDNTVPRMMTLGAGIFPGESPTEALSKVLESCADTLASDQNAAGLTLGAERLLQALPGDGRKGDFAGGQGAEQITPAARPLLAEIATQKKAGERARIVSVQSGTETVFLSRRAVSKGKGAKTRATASAASGSAILFLGPGPYNVGWGSEIDQALLATVAALKADGHRAYLLNNNPDALSLNPDLWDGICLEPPSMEAIAAALERWSIDRLVHQFCPDLPEGLESLLDENGVAVAGSPVASIRMLRDGSRHAKTLEEIGVPLLPYTTARGRKAALSGASKLGYPVSVRVSSSYLNPPAAILYDARMLREFLDGHAGEISARCPLFIEKYEEGLLGADVLALADGQASDVLAYVEGIEEHGVHRGDCASILPVLSFGDLHKALAQDALQRITSHYRLVGHIHLNLVIRDRNVYVTGCWPYPGRSLPFVEKTTGLQSGPAAARLLLGEKLADIAVPRSESAATRFRVKETVFPFTRFLDLDPVLGPRMSSTGQVMGSDESLGKAYLKSQMAANPHIPSKGSIFVSVRDAEKQMILQISRKLTELGFTIVSTQGTAQFLTERGIDVLTVNKISGLRPNVIDLIKNDEIALVVNIPGGRKSRQDEQVIRRTAIEHNIPIVTTTSGAFLMVQGYEEIAKSPLTCEPL